GRPGHPRPAERSGRGGLPQVRLGLPEFRVACRLRGRDRRAAPGTPQCGHGNSALGHERNRRTGIQCSTAGDGLAGIRKGSQKGEVMTETASSAAARKGKAAEGPRESAGGDGQPARRPKRRGLTMARIYTTPGVHPYDQVTWERRDVIMTNWRDGSINFEQR